MKKSTGLKDKNGYIIHVNDVCVSVLTYNDYMEAKTHIVLEDSDGTFTFNGFPLSHYETGNGFVALEIRGTK